MSVKELPPEKSAEARERRPLGRGGLPRVDWPSVRWVLQVAQVRLRFLVVLGVAFLVVGQWHVLRNYWDRFTAPAASGTLGGGISNDTEYFCPMCPGVLSPWPSKCSVCNMPLVRRRKGAAVQLPDGVVSRMQLSPYRVQLAGIHTSPIEFRPLARSVDAIGRVQGKAKADDSPPEAQTGRATIGAKISEIDLVLAAPGARCEATSDAYAGREPWLGQVVAIGQEVDAKTCRVEVVISVADPNGELRPGMRVRVRIERPIAELEPFCSQPADPPPLAKGEPRTLFVCLDHPQVIRERPGECPEDGKGLDARPLAELERVGWWCPMHPKVTSVEPGHKCHECNGMQLLPRIVRYRPAGQVLAVPASAVIDTGERRVAYVETMPGMFDGVEVTLGPRCDEFYPVIGGLAPGQRVATAGAFLLDAETRLNPSIAASYFGASRAGETPADAATPSVDAETGADSEAAEIRKTLAELPPAEREAAQRQKICPVTGLPLGSMGAPVKAAGEKMVWLCCDGCQASFAKDPAKHLKKLSARGKRVDP